MPTVYSQFRTAAALTGSRLLASSSSGNTLEPLSVTSTEAGYLSGVTSAIQTQLDARLPLAGGTLTGVLKFGASADVGLSRNASGILEVNSGTAGTYRDIKLRYVYGDNANVWAKFTNADGVLLNYGSGASAGLLTMAPGLTYTYGGTEVLRVGANKLSVNGLLGGGSIEATSYATGGSIFYGKALASQTGSLIKLVDSADASVFEVTASGGLKVGGTDVGIARNGSGVLEVNSGTEGTLRDLKLRDIILTGGNLAKSSGTAFSDGAGASVGTLANAPAVGDPTKWIPIDDNGTTRYIPAW